MKRKNKLILIFSSIIVAVLTATLCCILIVNNTNGNKENPRFVSYTEHYEGSQVQLKEANASSSKTYIPLASVTTASTSYSDSNTYLTISTANELYKFSSLCNTNDAFLGYKYKLLCNIDYQSETNMFIPIAWNADKRFSGVFDGDGYDISNLKMLEINSANASNYTKMDYFAMFSKVSGTVKNFGLIEPKIVITYKISTMDNNGISNVVGLNEGTVSGIYVNQLANTLLRECGIAAAGGYRVSGICANNTGDLSNCYIMTNSIYNYTTDVIEFADIVLNNTGKVTDCSFYNTSINFNQSTYPTEGGSYSFVYSDDLNLEKISGTTYYGKMITSLQLLNEYYDSKDGWFTSTDYNNTITLDYPIRRGIGYNESKYEITNANDFVYMFELMNSNALMASNQVTYYITQDIDLAGIPGSAYSYSRGIGANIIGKSDYSSKSTTLVNTLSTSYPTIYNAVIVDSSRKVATSGADCYGLFPYLTGTVENLNIVPSEINLDNVTKSNNSKAIGAVAGYVEKGTVSHVNVLANFTGANAVNLDSYYIGGITGILGGEGIIHDNTVAGSLNLKEVTQAIKGTFTDGNAIGGIVGYIENTLGDVYTCLNSLNINVELGANTTYSIGGVIGSGYTRNVYELENQGSITVGKNTGTTTYKEIYLSGVIARLLGQAINECYKLTNQGTVTLYGCATHSKSLVSGVLNADIKTSADATKNLYASLFKDNAGNFIFYASSLTNRASINVNNTGMNNNLVYSGVINVNSENGFKTRLKGVYNTNYTSLFNDNKTRTTAKLNNQLVDMNVANNYAGCVTVIGGTADYNTLLEVVYNLKAVDFTMASSLSTDVKYSGAVNGEFISYRDVRNECDMSFSINNSAEMATAKNLIVNGVFDTLSLNYTANEIYNGGNIAITDNASANVKLNIYASGILRENAAVISDASQNPLDSSFDKSLIGSLNKAINNGNILVTSSDLNKDKMTTNNQGTISSTTNLIGNIYAAGIIYRNSGIISNTFNLGDVELEVYALSEKNFYYAAGIAVTMTNEKAQIRDSANNGTISIISLSTIKNAKMYAGGIVSFNDQTNVTNKQIIAFTINYGTIKSFNGYTNMTSVSVDNAHAVSGGIIGKGICNIVNALNYGSVYSSEVSGGIIGTTKIVENTNSKINFANLINYGIVKALDKYTRNGETTTYLTFNGIKELKGVSNGVDIDPFYQYIGSVIGVFDFNSVANSYFNIRYLINFNTDKAIISKELNKPTGKIDTTTFITTFGSTDTFGGGSVKYAPMTSVNDEVGNIGVFSPNFVFYRAIDGIDIDSNIITDSYIADYFQFVRFDKVNSILLEKIGWQNIAYLDAAEALAKNLTLMTTFVDKAGLTASTELVNNALNNSWVSNCDTTIIAELVASSIDNSELTTSISSIIQYIFFEGSAYSSLTKELKSEIINKIIAYTEANGKEAKTILESLLYDELLAKIVAEDNADYSAVLNKIKEILNDSDNVEEILDSYISILTEEENNNTPDADSVLAMLFTGEYSENYLLKKQDLLTKLLNGFSNDSDALKELYSLISASGNVSNSLKYNLYLKDNPAKAKEIYSSLYTENSNNTEYYNLMNDSFKKYDTSADISKLASTSLANANFDLYKATGTTATGSTKLNGESYSYSNNYTDLWNIIKNDTSFLNYLESSTLFRTVTDPTTNEIHKGVIAKATEWNNTYQSQDAPSVEGNKTGVMRGEKGTVTANCQIKNRFIYTPDSVNNDKTYYYGPFDSDGNIWNSSNLASANYRKGYDIYNNVESTANVQKYFPFFMSANENITVDMLKANNVVVPSKNASNYKSYVSPFVWNDFGKAGKMDSNSSAYDWNDFGEAGKMDSNSSAYEWVSDYIIDGNNSDDITAVLYKNFNTGDYIVDGYDFGPGIEYYQTTTSSRNNIINETTYRNVVTINGKQTDLKLFSNNIYSNSQSNPYKDYFLKCYGTSYIVTGIWTICEYWKKESVNVGSYLTSKSDVTSDGDYNGIHTTQYTYYTMEDLVKLDGIKTKGNHASRNIDNDETAIISAILTEILKTDNGKKAVLSALSNYSYAGKFDINKDTKAIKLLASALQNTDFAANSITNVIAMKNDSILEKLSITSGTNTINLKTYLNNLIRNVNYTAKENLIFAGTTNLSAFRKILLTVYNSTYKVPYNSTGTNIISNKDTTYYLYKYVASLKESNPDITDEEILALINAVKEEDIESFKQLSDLVYKNMIIGDGDGDTDISGDLHNYGGNFDVDVFTNRLKYIALNQKAGNTSTYPKVVPGKIDTDTSESSNDYTTLVAGEKIPITVNSESVTEENYIKQNASEDISSQNIGYFLGNQNKITKKTITFGDKLIKPTDNNAKFVDVDGKTPSETKKTPSWFYVPKGEDTDYSGNKLDEMTEATYNDLPDDIKALLGEPGTSIPNKSMIRLSQRDSGSVNIAKDQNDAWYYHGQISYYGKTYGEDDSNDPTKGILLPNNGIWFKPQKTGKLRFVLYTHSDGYSFVLKKFNRVNTITSDNPFYSDSSTKITTETVLNYKNLPNYLMIYLEYEVTAEDIANNKEFLILKGDADGAYFMYMDIGTNGGVSVKTEYPNLDEIEERYNTYYPTLTGYGKYLANDMIVPTAITDNKITVNAPSIIFVKSDSDDGKITVNGVFKTSKRNSYKAFYLPSKGTYDITSLDTTITEVLVVDKTSSMVIGDGNNKITHNKGSGTSGTSKVLFTGCDYTSLNSYKLEFDDSRIDIVSVLFPTMKNGTNYSIFTLSAFDKEKYEELIRLLAIADDDNNNSALAKLINQMKTSDYKNLLKDISNTDIQKDIISKIINIVKESNSYPNELKMLTAAYIGNDYIANKNNIISSKLKLLLDNYEGGKYQFITGEQKIDKTIFINFINHLGGQTNLDGFGIYALSSSMGIKNGTFIPDNITLSTLDRNYNKDSLNGIIEFTETVNASWREVGGANSVNNAVNVEMKQLIKSISTALFELDLEYSDSVILYASSSTITNNKVVYYVPNSFIKNFGGTGISSLRVLNSTYANNATMSTPNAINISGGVKSGNRYTKENAFTITAEDTSIVTSYTVEFVGFDVSFALSSNKTTVPYSGGSVTLTVTSDTLPENFDLKPLLSIVNGDNTYNANNGWTFDLNTKNNGIVRSNHNATIVININETLPYGDEVITLDVFGTSKSVSIAKAANEIGIITNIEYNGLKVTFDKYTAITEIPFGRAFNYNELTDISDSSFYLNKLEISPNAIVSVSATMNKVMANGNDTGRIEYVVTFVVTSEAGTKTTYKHTLRESDYFSNNSSFASIYMNGENYQTLVTDDFKYLDDTVLGKYSSLTYNTNNPNYAAVEFNRGIEPEYRIKYVLNNFYTLSNSVSFFATDETMANGAAVSEAYGGLTIVVDHNLEPGTYKFEYTYRNTGVWMDSKEYVREYTFPTFYIVKNYSDDALLKSLVFLAQSVVIGNTATVIKAATKANNKALTISDYQNIFASSSRDINVNVDSIIYNNGTNDNSISDYYAIGTVSEADLSYYAPTFTHEEHAEIYKYTTKKKIREYGALNQGTTSDEAILSNHDDMLLYVPFVVSTTKEKGVNSRDNSSYVVYLVEVNENGTWGNIYDQAYDGTDSYTPLGSFKGEFTTLEAKSKSFTIGDKTYTVADFAGYASDSNVENISLYMDYIGTPLEGHFWYISYVIFSESYLHGERYDGNVRYYHISVIDSTNTVYFEVELYAPSGFSENHNTLFMNIVDNVYNDESLVSSRHISGYLEATGEVVDEKDSNKNGLERYILKYKLQSLPKGFFYFYIDLPDGYQVLATTDMENQLSKDPNAKKEVGSFLPFTSIVTRTINLEFIVSAGENTNASKWAVTTSDIYTRMATYNGVTLDKKED